jgi:thiamine biosynthesis lipoprotein
MAMGTFVALEAQAERAADALAAIDAAFDALSQVEALLHPRRVGSDLQRINAAPRDEWIEIDASTFEVLVLARRLYELTGGVFDPCVPDKPGRLEDLEIHPARPQGALSPTAWVRLRLPVDLDLGGIAKGYAVDQALEALMAGGCSGGLVNAGGDLRLYGPEGQMMLLRDGAGSERALTLSNTALAVSDADARFRPPEHRGYYARGTRAPLGRRRAAVLAPNALVADALTKCVLLCPQEMTEHILRDFGASVVT